jgi:pimeloyl-ACP methyl ester carboxylesterase
MTDSSPTMSITDSGIAFSDTGPRSDMAVVLIHGSLDRMAGMAHVARILQRQWRVIRYDRRGYGRSLSHDGPFHVSDHVSDLCEVMDTAGHVSQALLIGHSFGGHVALAGAIACPTQVIGASIYESPLSWMPWWPGTTAGNQAMATDPAEAAEVFMRRLVGDKKWDSLPEPTKLARQREGVALVGELTSLRSSAPYDFSDVLVPVLCGYGELGASRHCDGAQHVAHNVRHGTLVMIAGAGHGAPTSHPQEYVDAIVMPHIVAL